MLNVSIIEVIMIIILSYVECTVYIYNVELLTHLYRKRSPLLKRG